jgi:hypothetical protein
MKKSFAMLGMPLAVFVLTFAGNAMAKTGK